MLASSFISASTPQPARASGGGSQLPPICVSFTIHCMAQDWLDNGFARRRGRTPSSNRTPLDRSESLSRDSGQHYANPWAYPEWQPPEQFQPELNDWYEPHRNESGNQRNQILPNSRQQRRRRRFRDLLLGPIDNNNSSAWSSSEQSSPSFNIQMASTGSSRLSVYSAPDELEHEYMRSRTPTARPGNVLWSSPEDPLPVSFPRSPTYPPAVGSRSCQRGAADNTDFADAEEFHLFVQATTGLALDDTLGDSDLDRSHDSQQHEYYGTRNLVSWDRNDSPIVPHVEEASDTLIAVRHLAQTPSFPPGADPTFDLQPNHFEYESSVSDVDPVDVVDVISDELPNYQESQAQAHEHRRVEATRRAQELQARWRQSGARRYMHS